jgi:hypothetical protein
MHKEFPSYSYKAVVKIKLYDGAAIVVEIETCIREAFLSNFGRITGYQHEIPLPSLSVSPHEFWDSVVTCSIKVKLSLCLTKHHVMKAYWGSGGIAPRIL